MSPSSIPETTLCLLGRPYVNRLDKCGMNTFSLDQGNWHPDIRRMLVRIIKKCAICKFLNLVILEGIKDVAIRNHLDACQRTCNLDPDTSHTYYFTIPQQVVQPTSKEESAES